MLVSGLALGFQDTCILLSSIYWSGSSIHVLSTLLPLFISNTAHSCSPKDIWTSSENILTVWTRESSWSLFAPYNFRLSMNGWLIGVMFFWSLYSAFIFLGGWVSGSMITTKSNEDKESPWKIPLCDPFQQSISFQMYVRFLLLFLSKASGL